MLLVRPIHSTNPEAVKRRKGNATSARSRRLYSTLKSPFAVQGCGKGKNQPLKYATASLSKRERFEIATKAKKLMETDPLIQPLSSVEQKVQAAAIRLKFRQWSTLRNWVSLPGYQQLKDACTDNPDDLNDEGKHKGGRGKKKAGHQKKDQPKYDPWFPQFEAQLDQRVMCNRRLRVKVQTRHIVEWMNALIAQELRIKKEEYEHKSDEEFRSECSRLIKFKASRQWLTGFMKRHGLTRRRATNKRFLGAEDLLGDVLGFVRYLRQIRRDNPKDDDAVWGAYGQYTTFNCDSVPIPFASPDKVTVDKIGATRVSIIQGGSKLDYRQATLHLTTRPKGKQPWPSLLFRGKTYEQDEKERMDRTEEMGSYDGYHVHVLWQKNAWVDEKISTNHWTPAFKKDLEMLGLEGEEVLLLMDNLEAQKTEAFREGLAAMKVKAVYGPKNGTDIWQPVDHGIGQKYQSLLDASYVEWTKTPECLASFKSGKIPGEKRRRQLMVQWVHSAYEQLEMERQEQEERGEKTIFEKAFLRTGCLVSANSDDVDNEMNPEGLTKAMAESEDPYYRQHEITSFRDLLSCSDGSCRHAIDERVVPAIAAIDQQADTEKLANRFDELEKSSDKRAHLLVKCLKSGFKWAGSSFTEFLSKGTDALLAFLSETQYDLDDGEDGDAVAPLSHDIDLYRHDDKTKQLGARFVGGNWKIASLKKAGGVDKVALFLKADPNTRLEIDQVNLHKSNMNPSCDLWPNLCASFNNGVFGAELLWPDRGPPLDVTVHNALRLNSGTAVPCYVLRRKAMPTYDDASQFQQDESYCDGRFRGKLHQRANTGLVKLLPFWNPGPHIPPLSYFDALNRINEEERVGSGEEGNSEEDEGGGDGEDEVDSRLLQHEVTLAVVRNWQPSNDSEQQEKQDELMARRLALQSELNPYGESMRNRRAVDRPSSTRPARSSAFRGSYADGQLN